MWSFLFGQNHGKVELILDNAPARSAELLAQARVDAALVPVIAYQMLEGVRLIPDVCVGARRSVRSVCLATKGKDLEDVRSVSLDTSSRTSEVLTKILFREYLGHEPAFISSAPNIDQMLAVSDCALLIGDPALKLSNSISEISDLKYFDLAELWHSHTGLGFVFAMWMTWDKNPSIDFTSARDEGLAHIDEIIANYDVGLGADEMREYLLKNISYSIDGSMQNGMDLYFQLAAKHKLIDRCRPIEFV